MDVLHGTPRGNSTFRQPDHAASHLYANYSNFILFVGHLFYGYRTFFGFDKDVSPIPVLIFVRN